jgi:hypothetical protein
MTTGSVSLIGLITTMDKLLLISYWPYYWRKHRNHAHVNLDKIELPPDIDTQARACLWINHKGSIEVILLLDNAKELAEDLTEWAEDEPTKWFTLDIVEANDTYTLALMPDLVKTTRRHKLARFIAEEQIIEPTNIIFRPFYFTSQPGDNIYQTCKNDIQDTIAVSFIDTQEINPQDPEATDFDKRHNLGEFKVRKLTEQNDQAGFAQYLLSLLKDNQ